MNAHELFQAGQLSEALSAAQAAVKAKPDDVRARSFFCELLCFAGELERADKQLDAVASLDEAALLGVSLFRQLIRAEIWRQQFYREGRPPEVVEELSEEFKLRLQASVALRDQETAAAAQALQTAESLRRQSMGQCDGRPFEGIRDLDDLLGSVLEVLTSTGKYYWVPWDRVVSLEFSQVKHARDLLFRPAEIVVRDGPQGEVYLPVLYAGTQQSDDEKTRLGRATDWINAGDGVTLGAGQRMLLIGDDAQPLLQIREIEVHQPVTS